MSILLAQRISINGQIIEGPLKGINSIADVVNVSLSFIYPLAGILLLIFLITGGFQYLTSQGDPEKIQSAQKKITYALIGIILLAFSYLIVKIISFIFGLGEGIF